MKKRLLLICGILILVAVIALEATNAMNKGSTNTEEVISKPNKNGRTSTKHGGIGVAGTSAAGEKGQYG